MYIYASLLLLFRAVFFHDFLFLSQMFHLCAKNAGNSQFFNFLPLQIPVFYSMISLIRGVIIYKRHIMQTPSVLSASAMEWRLFL